MKSVSLFSGGADSLLATLMVIEDTSAVDVDLLFVDYGQPYKEQELKAVMKLKKKLKLGNLKVVTISGLYNPDKVYIPLRNLVLTSIGLAYCTTIEAEQLITGSKSLTKIDDDYSFYDSTVPFFKMMQGVVDYAKEDNVTKLEIVCPLTINRESKLSKIDVYKQLLQYGITPKETWSCFSDGEEECGKCHNCEVKEKICKELKL